MMSSTKKVYMGCRSESKAINAIASLKGMVDTTKLHYIHFDASESQDEIFNLVHSLDQGEQLTGLLLNAGGIGHDKSKKPSGPNHVLDIHQINLIGHIQLVEALKSSAKMAKGCKIVFSGSEAARGVPMMMIGKPKLGETSAWFEKQLKGEFRGFDPMVSAKICMATSRRSVVTNALLTRSSRPSMQRRKALPPCTLLSGRFRTPSTRCGLSPLEVPRAPRLSAPTPSPPTSSS